MVLFMTCFAEKILRMALLWFRSCISGGVTVRSDTLRVVAMHKRLKERFFDSSAKLMFQFDPSGFADLKSNGGPEII